MPKKTDIRICRFRECCHDNKCIDISTDKYIKINNLYYHEDCYNTKQKEDEELKIKRNNAKAQSVKEKDDLFCVIDLWSTHINKQANFSQLRRILNDFVKNGVPSEQLVFTLKYVISHNMKLNYPAGFKYYVENKKIQNAYSQSLCKTQSQKGNQNEVVKLNEDNAPKFTFNPPALGFSSILKRRR